MTCSSAVTWWDKSSMFRCRLCDSPDKTLTRRTGRSLLNLMSSWALPSPVTCDKQQPAGSRLSPSAAQTSYGSTSFSLFKFSETVCDGSFVRSAALRRAFSLSLMALDKHSYWLQTCLTLKGCLPMVLYLVCSLFYKCHCHILLNLSVSFPPLEPVSTLQV